MERAHTVEVMGLRTDITDLKSQYQSLSQQLQAEKIRYEQIIVQLSGELEAERKARAYLEEKYESLTQQHKDALDKIAVYEKEKKGLIETALNAQADQRKLKLIIDSYTSAQKQEPYVKMIYGDLSYLTMSQGATKIGAVKKQGGENKNKWQKRILVLNDQFLLYYSSPNDKEPKGTIILDSTLTATSKVDLTKLVEKSLGIKNSFTIKRLDKSGRSFFFACQSEEDCFEWLRVLLLAQGWSEQEVQVYLEANFENKATLRSIKGRLVLDD